MQKQFIKDTHRKALPAPSSAILVHLLKTTTVPRVKAVIGFSNLTRRGNLLALCEEGAYNIQEHTDTQHTEDRTRDFAIPSTRPWLHSQATLYRPLPKQNDFLSVVHQPDVVLTVYASFRFSTFSQRTVCFTYSYIKKFRRLSCYSALLTYVFTKQIKS